MPEGFLSWGDETCLFVDEAENGDIEPYEGDYE